MSLVHSTVIVYLAATKLFNPALHEDRAFGWDNSVGINAGIAAGCVYLRCWILETRCSVSLSYFIWDTLDAVINFVDAAFVLHGKCACRELLAAQTN